MRILIKYRIENRAEGYLFLSYEGEVLGDIKGIIELKQKEHEGHSIFSVGRAWVISRLDKQNNKNYLTFLAFMKPTFIDKISPYIIKASIILFAITIFTTVGTFILASTFPNDKTYNVIANITSHMLLVVVASIFMIASVLLITAKFLTDQFWGDVSDLEKKLDRKLNPEKEITSYAQLPEILKERLAQLKELRNKLKIEK